MATIQILNDNKSPYIMFGEKKIRGTKDDLINFTTKLINKVDFQTKGKYKKPKGKVRKSGVALYDNQSKSATLKSVAVKEKGKKDDVSKLLQLLLIDLLKNRDSGKRKDEDVISKNKELEKILLLEKEKQRLYDELNKKKKLGVSKQNNINIVSNLNDEKKTSNLLTLDIQPQKIELNKNDKKEALKEQINKIKEDNQKNFNRVQSDINYDDTAERLKEKTAKEKRRRYLKKNKLPLRNKENININRKPEPKQEPKPIIIEGPEHGKDEINITEEVPIKNINELINDQKKTPDTYDDNELDEGLKNVRQQLLNINTRELEEEKVKRQQIINDMIKIKEEELNNEKGNKERILKDILKNNLNSSNAYALQIHNEAVAEELRRQETGYYKNGEPVEYPHGYINTPINTPLNTQGRGKEDKRIIDTINKNGLSNQEIESVMHKVPDFIGVISADQIPKLTNYINGRKKIGFIMNTAKQNEKGEHWVNCVVDGDKGTVEYYNSFGLNPTKEFLKDIRLVTHSIDPNKDYQLKINKICVQDDDKHKNDCGYFAMKELQDRLIGGKTFKEASGYNNAILHKEHEGGKEIDKFKKKIGIEPFKNIRGGADPEQIKQLEQQKNITVTIPSRMTSDTNLVNHYHSQINDINQQIINLIQEQKEQPNNQIGGGPVFSKNKVAPEPSGPRSSISSVLSERDIEIMRLAKDIRNLKIKRKSARSHNNLQEAYLISQVIQQKENKLNNLL